MGYRTDCVALVHQILERITPGLWTAYYYLADAVGTSAQVIVTHLANCSKCTGPYRVQRHSCLFQSGHYRRSSS